MQRSEMQLGHSAGRSGDGLDAFGIEGALVQDDESSGLSERKKKSSGAVYPDGGSRGGCFLRENEQFGFGCISAFEMAARHLRGNVRYTVDEIVWRPEGGSGLNT